MCKAECPAQEMIVSSMQNLNFGKTLVIAPHPDDEVLGAGGTIARLVEEGVRVEVAIATRGFPPAFSEALVEQVRSEAKLAHAHLGVSKTHWLDLPAAQLTETATAEINRALHTLVSDVNPHTLLIPFIGDIHVDHQRIFMSALVASRPHQSQFPKRILAYETLSETNWNAPYLTPAFVPQVYVEIDRFLARKIAAFKMFTSQQKTSPHERSPEGIETLARYRGAAVHRHAAEAYVMVRELN
jgi:N-acetylglucosamine malate deacetylase 1